MAIKTDVNTEWMDTSKAVPLAKDGHVKRKCLDVPYGPDPLQKMDILLPDVGEGPFPLIIDIHGGGMTACDKHDFHMYPMFYAIQRGFAASCINYRLSPQVTYPTQVYDTKQAILYLFEHAQEYKIDPNNFFLWGTSAGGNLALMCGLNEGIELPQNLRQADEVPIRAVAALCPGIDMEHFGYGNTLLEKIGMMILKFGYHKKVYGVNKPTAEQFAKSNPLTYIGKGIAPLYLQHGDCDGAVPLKQSLDCYEAAKNVLEEKDLVLEILPGVKHAGDGPEFYKEHRITPILDFFTAHIHQ